MIFPCVGQPVGVAVGIVWRNSSERATRHCSRDATKVKGDTRNVILRYSEGTGMESPDDADASEYLSMTSSKLSPRHCLTASLLTSADGSAAERMKRANHPPLPAS